MSKILDHALLTGFLEASRSGSLGIAARTLGRSQPLLTHQIQRLEDIVGCPLFVRTPRGVTLTPKGVELLVYAKRIIAVSEEAIKRFATNDRNRGGRIRIRLSEDLAGEAVLKSLLAATPFSGRLDLEIVSSGEAPSATAFEQGEVDIFLGDPSPNLSAILGPPKIGSVRLLWVASPYFDVARRPLPLGLYPEDCAWRRRIVEAMDKNLVDWFAAVESEGLSALNAAARCDMAMIACLPPSLAQGLIAVDHKAHGLPEPPEVEIAMYKASFGRPPSEFNALGSFLWELINDACRQQKSESIF
jgi:DNA-binding transcriptional LysR family regulator